MSEMIEDLVKKGPAIQFASDRLMVSRQTFYRLMHQYQEGNTEKMNPHVKAYFDQLMEGKFSSVEEAKKYLDNTHLLIVAEAESRKENLEERRMELVRERHILLTSKATMNAEEYHSKMSEIMRQIRMLDEERGGPRSFRNRRYAFVGAPMWVGEQMRSCVIGGPGDLTIVLDCEFHELSTYSVDILMKIDEQYYPIARLESRNGSKMFSIDGLPRNAEYCYRIVRFDGQSYKYSENRDLPATDY